MNGCDIASYQGTVDFDTLKTQVGFVITKATEGVGFKDSMFDRNWSESRRVGLVRGAYHYAHPNLGNSALDEASYFLSTVQAPDPGDILALDYEVQWSGDVVSWCKTWLDAVKQSTGLVPYIYLNLSLVRSYDWSPLFGYPLWLADYDGQSGSVPQTPWPVAIKQWTSQGTLVGITGHVDLNTKFGGDMDQAQVQALIDAAIAAYGQRLQAELDANYALKTHTHPLDAAPPHSHPVTGTAS